MVNAAVLLVVLSSCAVLGCGSDSRDPSPPPTGDAPADPDPAPPAPDTPPSGGANPDTPRVSEPPPTVDVPLADAALLRKLGGAGDEWARGIAVAPDGHMLVVTAITPALPVHLNDSWYFVEEPWPAATFGLVELSPSGTVLWAREVSVPNRDVVGDVTPVSKGPGGGWFLLVEAYTSGIDFGGGGLTGKAVVELDATGAFVGQRLVDAFPRIASDARGNLLVAEGGIVRKYDAMGELLWERHGLDGRATWADVAAHRSGDVAIAWSVPGDPATEPWPRLETYFETLTAEGTRRWITDEPLLGSTANVTLVDDGSVVAYERFGWVTLGKDEVNWTAYPGALAWVAVIGADGTPRWLRSRGGVGPMAVTGDGRIVQMTTFGASEVGWQRYPSCGWTVDTRDLDGNLVDSRRVVACDTGLGPWWATLSASGDGRVWLVGDSNSPFTAGGVTVEPAARDVFVLRLDQ